MPTVKISDTPIRTYHLTELTDECIDKIADAVVKKLRAEQTEPIPHDDYIESGNDHLKARCLNCNNAKACKEKHWEGCVYEPKDEKTCDLTECKEMEKLREALTANDIIWTDASDEGLLPITRTHFEYKGYKWSVIHGHGTYGGFSLLEPDAGLLEIMSNAVDDGNPMGWLTAEEVMDLVLGQRSE